MRFLVAALLLAGALMLLAGWLPGRPEARPLVPLSPLRVATGLV
jgi:hypothetical protein